MPPGTPSNPTPPPTSQYFSATTLTTIPGPQLTTRYGPQSNSAATSPGGPTLTTIQGPQLTTRYTLPGLSTSSPNTPNVNRTASGPTLPRTPSQTFYHHHPTTPSVASPLSMPSATGTSQLPSQQQFSSVGGGLMLPTNATPSGGSTSTATAAVAAATGNRGGGRKPMSLRGSFAKECTSLDSTFANA